MKRISMLLTFPVLALALTAARDASACGGCFIPEEESTQVTGHKMLVSMSMTETTLWDQIQYAGEPSSFAWVLPTKGIVEIGLSSDLVFAFLGSMTGVTVAAPPLNCPPPPWCYDQNDASFGDTGSSATGGGGEDGGVTVIAEEVVGPYETVQLSASDPSALKDWLTSHNYDLPAEVAPIVDAYVNEGFNFLALKLVPGFGVDSMRPVRITTAGAGIGLPLRMVAAGTGAVTPITLWVASEGRYEPANFPSFTIDSKDLVWDWDTQSSNYTALKQLGFDNTGGSGWLIEAARPSSRWELENQVMNVAYGLPEQSGYGDVNGQGAQDEAQEDMNKIFNALDEGSIWLSRMHAELPRVSLGSDLVLGASADQTNVSNFLQATQSKGTIPECPVYPPCSGDGSGSDFFGSGGSGATGEAEPAGGGCAVGERSSGVPASFAVIALALGLGLSLRRRSSR